MIETKWGDHEIHVYHRPDRLTVLMVKDKETGECLSVTMARETAWRLGRDLSRLPWWVRLLHPRNDGYLDS